MMFRVTFKFLRDFWGQNYPIVTKIFEPVLKVYLSCCPLATDSRLLLRLAKQQHFVDSHSDYTLNDLFEINSGKLIDFLTDVHADFARHIKLDCDKCQGKYFHFLIFGNFKIYFQRKDLFVNCVPVIQ